MANIPCNLLKDKFDPLKETLEKLIKGPLALIRAGEKIVAAAKNLSADIWNAIDDMIDLPSPDVDLSAWRNSLSVLRNCSYFTGDSAALSAFDGALDAIDQGLGVAGLPSDFTEMQQGVLQDGASSILNQALNQSVLGKLFNIKQQYQGLLVELGIYQVLDQMDMLVNCMSSVCNGVDGADLYVEEVRDKLKIGLDDMADPDFSNSVNIDESKRQALTASESALGSIKDAIAGASYF